MTGRIIDPPAGRANVSADHQKLWDRIHNPPTIDTTAEAVVDEEVIRTAQAVFPGATVKSRRGPLPVIIQDVQEKTPLARYFDAKAVQVETVHLETGDYSLKNATHLLAIERKSLPDLLHCVTHDRERFMDQMRRLKNYPSRFLIVEATRATIEAEAYKPDVRASSIVGTLLGLAVRWNICVVYCKDQREAAERVQWICLKVAQLQKEGFYDEQDSNSDVRLVEPHDSALPESKESCVP